MPSRYASDIERCPFCGGDAAEPDANDHTWCTNIACGSDAYMHVDAWNRRQEREKIAAVLKQARDCVIFATGDESSVAVRHIDQVIQSISLVGMSDQWQPISTYHAADKFVKVQHILCGHSEGKWIRMGRYYPEMKRWYYSGTNERSQWAQVEGDEPTHWQPLPNPPQAEEQESEA